MKLIEPGNAEPMDMGGQLYIFASMSISMSLSTSLSISASNSQDECHVHYLYSNPEIGTINVYHT
jgi:hypothetical protein